jgi:hypothetical protein
MPWIAQLARTEMGSSLNLTNCPVLYVSEGGIMIISLSTYVIACSDDPININS